MNGLARIYFKSWLQRTFTRSWTVAMVSAGFLGYVVNVVADQYPAWSALANRAAWQLPLALFILALIPAAIHASWKLWEDGMNRFVKAADEATELREQLAERTNYRMLANALSGLHREASEGWINLNPNSDQALAEVWRPKANPWFAKVKAVLTATEVPASDMAHFEVVNNLDIDKFNAGIEPEVRKMWVRVERLGELIKRYEDVGRKQN